MPRRPARLRLQSLEDRTTPSTPPIRPGFVFDGPAFTDNSPGAFPPSPAIAVGPAHAVTVTAATIQWQALPSSKSAAGAPVKQPLKDFFVSAQGGTFASPRVIYDQVAGRFVIAVVETRASPTPTARIRLAVSDDANPNGTWHRFFIDADADDIAGADCAAYLGLAADEEAVYITATHHAFLDDTYQDARIYIVNKGVSGGWYAGQPAAFRRFDPDPVGPPADVFGIVPAQVHGPPPAGATGTYLVSYSGRPGLGTTEAATVIRIDNPLAPSPTFAAMQIELGDIDADTGQELPDAPQPGSPVAIDTGDRRIGNAVWLEDRLYFAATVKPPSGPDAGQATAHWFQVRTTDNVVERQGDIGGEGNSVGLHTFFPSVAVDELGNLAVTFAAANAETFLGSYYAARLFTESEMSSPVAMDNGPGFPYVRRPGNAGSASPWGAYSSTVVAPNGRVFWTFNAFPDFPDPDPPEGTDPGRWATRAGAFSFNWPSDPDDPSVLGPQTVVEDSEPLEIDLDSHFRDFETGGATTLTYSIIGNTNPALVATSFPSRNILRLTLAPNGAGVAVLTVRAQDAGTVEALPASTDDTFTLTVTPVNDPPVAVSDSYSTNEDTTLTVNAPGVLANDLDPDVPDTRTAVLVEGPSNAQSFTLNPNGSFTYTPAANFFGTDGFRYKVRDAAGLESDVVEVTIAVQAVNDRPVATADAYSTVEDTPLQVDAPGVLSGDTDVEGSPLTALLQQGPAHAQAFVLNPDGSFAYTPAANFNGTDSFIYVANDGDANSDPVTVTLTVTPVQDSPVAIDDVADTTGAPVRVNVLRNDFHPDGEVIRLTSYTRPTKGKLVRSGNALIYTPTPGATGQDTFAYTISDLRGRTDTATVTINIADTVVPKVQAVRLYYGNGRFIDLRSLTRAVLPWETIRKVEVVFTEDVLVDAIDLALAGLGGAIGTAFSYSSTTRTATWTPLTAIGSGRYSIRLSGAGVTDLAGNPLGADWAKSFGLLAGDYNGDGAVTDSDLKAIQSRFNSTDRFADIDGTGFVNQADLNAATGNKGKRLA